MSLHNINPMHSPGVTLKTIIGDACMLSNPEIQDKPWGLCTSFEKLLIIISLGIYHPRVGGEDAAGASEVFSAFTAEPYKPQSGAYNLFATAFFKEQNNSVKVRAFRSVDNGGICLQVIQHDERGGEKAQKILKLSNAEAENFIKAFNVSRERTALSPIITTGRAPVIIPLVTRDTGPVLIAKEDGTALEDPYSIEGMTKFGTELPSFSYQHGIPPQSVFSSVKADLQRAMSSTSKMKWFGFEVPVPFRQHLYAALFPDGSSTARPLTRDVANRLVTSHFCLQGNSELPLEVRDEIINLITSTEGVAAILMSVAQSLTVLRPGETKNYEALSAIGLYAARLSSAQVSPSTNEIGEVSHMLHTSITKADKDEHRRHDGLSDRISLGQDYTKPDKGAWVVHQAVTKVGTDHGISVPEPDGRRTFADGSRADLAIGTMTITARVTVPRAETGDLSDVRAADVTPLMLDGYAPGRVETYGSLHLVPANIDKNV